MPGQHTNSTINTILRAFQSRGQQRYGSEDVMQLQHALQCGQLAVSANASQALVAAALLHDIGHILDNHEPTQACKESLDDKHETRGYDFLLAEFGPAVADPVRLHVLAKRYLCTVDPDYQHQLSPTSHQSYLDQGGPLSDRQLEAFQAEPYYRDALHLRRWDDAAKRSDALTPPLEYFVPFLEATIIPSRCS